MLQSMTAFGKAKMSFPGMSISIEVHSVNRKFLEVQTKTAAEWHFFEPEIRTLVSECVDRGQITVSMNVVYTDQTAVAVHLNEGYALSLLQAMNKLAGAIGYSAKPETLFEAVLKEKGIFQAEILAQDSVEVQENIKSTLKIALSDLVQMRKREGALLANEFEERLLILRKMKDLVAAQSVHAPSKYRDKISTLLQEFVTCSDELKDRVAKEVALMADKVDIAEEISRLGFHLDHFEEMLQSQKPVGKVLEFILQEILREVNTIASKSQDAEISRSCITAKSEIEKMKEQVQNVQ